MGNSKSVGLVVFLAVVSTGFGQIPYQTKKNPTTTDTFHKDVDAGFFDATPIAAAGKPPAQVVDENSSRLHGQISKIIYIGDDKAYLASVDKGVPVAGEQLVILLAEPVEMIAGDKYPKGGPGLDGHAIFYYSGVADFSDDTGTKHTAMAFMRDRAAAIARYKSEQPQS